MWWQWGHWSCPSVVPWSFVLPIWHDELVRESPSVQHISFWRAFRPSGAYSKVSVSFNFLLNFLNMSRLGGCLWKATYNPGPWVGECLAFFIVCIYLGMWVFIFSWSSFFLIFFLFQFFFFLFLLGWAITLLRESQYVCRFISSFCAFSYSFYNITTPTTCVLNVLLTFWYRRIFLNFLNCDDCVRHYKGV